MNNELVTAAEHDAGFKEIEILYRSGRRENLKLTAPNYRRAQQLALKLSQTKDPLCITEACLPKEHHKEAENFLSRLTPECGAVVEAISFVLTFGNEFQKKMQAAGEKLLQAMTSTDFAPSSPSLPQDIPPGKSEDSPFPSCESTSDSPVSDKSSTTCAASSSPVAVV